MSPAERPTEGKQAPERPTEGKTTLAKIISILLADVRSVQFGRTDTGLFFEVVRADPRRAPWRVQWGEREDVRDLPPSTRDHGRSGRQDPQDTP
jgi:hypothetical protein